MNAKTRMVLVTLLLVAGLFLSMNPLFAQNGRIAGTVMEKGKNQALIGANVSIVGTNIGTATDNQGKFLIGNVPPGTYQILARYIGYTSVEQTVQVTVGRVSTINFELVGSVLEMGTLEITAERLLQSQSAALNAQYEASNIKNVISSDLLGSFPDEEAVEAIARIPGVVVDGTEAYMRGLPADWALTTVNGEKIPAVNAAEDRHASLNTFPIDLIQAIEVSKGQTADMDADAIAGNINFILKDAPSSRMFSAKIYQGYNTDRTSDYPIKQFDFFGPTKASLTIGDTFLDGKMAYSIAGTYERETKSEYNDRFAWDFGNTNWPRYQKSVDRDGNPTPPGLRYHSKRPTETIESRAGFNTALVWRPSLGNKVVLKAFYSAYNLTDYDLELTDRYTSWRGTRFYDGYITKLNDVKNEPTNVTAITAGGEHMVFGDATLNYTVQLTSGRGGENHDVQVDFESTYSDRAEGDKNFYFIENNFERETFKEDEILASLNLKKPFFSENIRGYFKAGLKYKNKDRYNQKLDSNIEPFDRELTPDELEDLADDGIPYPKKWFVGEYDPFIVEYDPPLNMVFLSTNSTTIDENYLANENILAAYAMSEIWLGKNLMVLPGVRVEKTHTDTESRLVDTFIKYNPEAPEQSSVDSKVDYTDVFPSLHLRYRLPNDINIRLSGTKGIARPSFRYFVGFNQYNIGDKELFTGNPDIRPTRSQNLDLILEHYSPGMASHMSAGLFYKKIDNVIDEVIFTPASGVFNGYEVDQVIQPQNVGTGRAFGLELSLQRQLDFLGIPQVGILANWTHQLDTYLEDMNGEKRSLPSQADNVINLAVSYEMPRIGFSGRLSYNWLSEIFLGFIENGEEWRDARNTLDLTLRQRVAPGVRLFLKGNNLLGEDSIRRFKNLRTDSPNTMHIYDHSFRGQEVYGGFEFSF